MIYKSIFLAPDLALNVSCNLYYVQADAQTLKTWQKNNNTVFRVLRNALWTYCSIDTYCVETTSSSPQKICFRPSPHLTPDRKDGEGLNQSVTFCSNPAISLAYSGLPVLIRASLGMVLYFRLFLNNGRGEKRVSLQNVTSQNVTWNRTSPIQKVTS